MVIQNVDFTSNFDEIRLIHAFLHKTKESVRKNIGSTLRTEILSVKVNSK